MWFRAILALLVLSGCASSAEDSRRARIAESVESTVLLTTERATGGRRAGSGVILGTGADDRVLVATTAHLLTPLTTQAVKVSVPHLGAVAEADIVAVDEEADLALLAAPLDGLPPVSMKGTAQLGDSVWVVGFPWGKSGTLVNGAVSQIGLSPDKTGVVIDGAVRMIDAPVNYGTSGGGVVEARTGRLVGIVRGYRTVKMSVPGSQDAALTLPVAGETTVIPTNDILCFLQRRNIHPVPATARLAGTNCSVG